MKFNHRKDTHRIWKQLQVSLEDYRDTVQRCKAALRKAKAHLELNLERDVKSNKKGFCQYLNSKRPTRKNVGLLRNGNEDLVRKDIKKAEALNAFFSLVCIAKTSLHVSWAPETCVKSKARKIHPMVEEDQAREHLNRLDMHKHLMECTHRN